MIISSILIIIEGLACTTSVANRSYWQKRIGEGLPGASRWNLTLLDAYRNLGSLRSDRSANNNQILKGSSAIPRDAHYQDVPSQLQTRARLWRAETNFPDPTCTRGRDNTYLAGARPFKDPGRPFKCRRSYLSSIQATIMHKLWLLNGPSDCTCASCM